MLLSFDLCVSKYSPSPPLTCLGTKPCRLGKLSFNPRFFILSGNSANGNCLNRTFVEMPIYLFDSISTLLNISIGAVEGELGRSVSVWRNEKLEDGPRLLWQVALEEERRGQVMVSDFILEAAAGFHEGNVIEPPAGSFARGPKETTGGRRIYFSRRRDSL
ncbi:hypothetical protein AYX15_07092 [Cryptococcus neoformans]|nr:hypothetical protein AYX15_07092 [Cryptococcus neoformans var. grubii]